MRLFRLLPVLACLLACSPPARSDPGPAQLCSNAIAAAERAERTPDRLMQAIALVESGRPDPRTGAVQPWPWTINVAGAGHFFDSKQAAVEAVAALQARGVRSIDVGCMQVNLLHHPAAFATLGDAFEPSTNAAYAGRFLTALYRGLGAWERATAAYHSQTEQLGADYARRVMAVWGHPMDAPAAGPGRLGAALAMAAQPYGAFAPSGMIFGAFADPATLPLSLRAHGGLPARENRRGSARR